jgi:hypothetical protein
VTFRVSSRVRVEGMTMPRKCATTLPQAGNPPHRPDVMTSIRIVAVQASEGHGVGPQVIPVEQEVETITDARRTMRPLVNFAIDDCGL